MGNHLEFDEIVDYIWCEEMNPSTLVLAQRVNSHIAECEECRAQYNLLLDIYQSIQEVQDVKDLCEEQRSIISALLKQKHASSGEIKERWLRRLGMFAMSFSLKIENGEKLILSHLVNYNTCADYSFGYPVALGVRSNAQVANNKKNILIDDENELNQIRSENDVITIQLDASEWEGREPDLLVMNGNGVIEVLDTFERKGDCFIVQISSETSHRYTFFVG